MGHVPEWIRGNMGKGGAGSAPAKSPTKYGVVSRPIFHSETQNFADGGEATAIPVDMPEAPKPTALSDDRLGDFIKSVQEDKPAEDRAESSDMSEHKTFGKAFSAARGAGMKTFDWNGKKYTTDVAAPSKPKAPSQPSMKSSSPEQDYEASNPVQTPYAGPTHDELTYPSVNTRRSGKTGKDFVRERMGKK